MKLFEKHMFDFPNARAAALVVLKMSSPGGSSLSISGSNAAPDFNSASDAAKKMGNDNLRHRTNSNPPAYGHEDQQRTQIDGTQPSFLPQNFISHMPVQYDGPSKTKAELSRRNELVEQAGVIRTMPIDKELEYMQYMEDVQELAKFDNYVEALVDPKAPGSADFLFKVYPEYVNRRMSQAQQDYEYALRNQMIDMWGINSFDDLYFKYMVDQGVINGPRLMRDQEPKTADDEFISYALLPGRFKRTFDPTTLKLPYTSSKIGSKNTAQVNRSEHRLPFSGYYPGQPPMSGRMAAEPGPMAYFGAGNKPADMAQKRYSWAGGRHARKPIGTLDAGIYEPA
jgi:hypothetical protein